VAGNEQAGDPLTVVQNPTQAQRNAFIEAFSSLLDLEQKLIIYGRDPEGFREMTRYEDGQYLQLSIAAPPADELRGLKGFEISDEARDVLKRLQNGDL
jgi:hypothetical protein